MTVCHVCLCVCAHDTLCVCVCVCLQAESLQQEVESSKEKLEELTLELELLRGEISEKGQSGWLAVWLAGCLAVCLFFHPPVYWIMLIVTVFCLDLFEVFFGVFFCFSVLTL